MHTILLRHINYQCIGKKAHVVKIAMHFLCYSLAPPLKTLQVKSEVKLLKFRVRAKQESFISCAAAKPSMTSIATTNDKRNAVRYFLHNKLYTFQWHDQHLSA